MRHHYKLFFPILFFIFLSSPLTAQAADTICAWLPELVPKVVIIDKENDLQYDFSVSRKNLSSVKQQYEQSRARLFVSGDTLGLTLGGYNYKKSMALGFFRMGLWGPVHCPRLDRVLVEFSYDSSIYVAKEYAGNKCAFDVIVKHELDHHQVNITNKRKYMQWLNDDLPSIIASIAEQYGPVSSDMKQAVYDKMQAEINDAIGLYFNKMNSDKKIQNAKLDTHDEYVRLNHQIRQCFSKSKR